MQMVGGSFFQSGAAPARWAAAVVWLAAATGNGRLGAQNRKQAIQKVSFCSAPKADAGDLLDSLLPLSPDSLYGQLRFISPTANGWPNWR